MDGTSLIISVLQSAIYLLILGTYALMGLRSPKFLLKYPNWFIIQTIHNSTQVFFEIHMINKEAVKYAPKAFTVKGCFVSLVI